MIRLPPTAINLGASDLKDFERRQKRLKEREAKKNLHMQFARYEIGAQDGPSSDFPSMPCCNERIIGEHLINHPSTSSTQKHSPVSRALIDQPLGSPQLPIGTDEIELFVSTSPSASSVSLSRLSSPENVPVEVEQPSSSRKDEFHYGGFIESPNHNTSHLQSSPFAPDDISTSPQLLLPIRPRLPRSPLVFSHNASSSPERTTSLTPRVASRINTHHTPGVIFAQPPRRPRYRHQTNSFSFDESSERASAVYGQDRVSSTSTADSRTHEELSLREELRGSSLDGTQDDDVPDGLSNFIFSSPQLPPPFSASRRVSKGGEMLPLAASTSPYRSRTPLSGSPTPTKGGPRTPSYHIYNDSQPPASQPQTPAHLPESRHRSRFHPSYTAPMPQVNSVSEGPARARRIGLTPTRRSMTRSDSPIGLLGEGFNGLYGGQENGDDEQNLVDGLRASNAAMRVWGRESRGS